MKEFKMETLRELLNIYELTIFKYCQIYVRMEVREEMKSLSAILDPELFTIPISSNVSSETKKSAKSLREELIKQFFVVLYLTELKFQETVKSIKINENTKFINEDKFISSFEETKFLEQVKGILFNHHSRAEDFGQMKYIIDSTFYDISEKGAIDYSYQKEYLLTTTQAGKKLGVSRETINKYIKYGLESVSINSHNRIPMHAVLTWKDPLFSMKLQTLTQRYQHRESSIQDYLKELKNQIAEFENKYNGTFNEIFAAVLSGEQDADEIGLGLDYEIWKETLEEIEEIESSLSNEHF